MTGLVRRATLAIVFAAATPLVAAVPSFAEVKSAHRASDDQLLDRHGVPLQTLRTDDRVRRLPWVVLEDMSPALRHAIVLSEDRRFHEHAGIDWAAVARSAWANLWDTRTRGASTLTMQLAGLIDEGLARPAGGRSVAQKLGQAVTAVQLESRWRKSEILEAYLNAVPFRGELVGIGALAQTLFGKHPSGLDAQEAAIAAALVRAPNAPAARVAERACGVLQAQALRCEGVRALAERALARQGGMPLGEQLAPHFARRAFAQGIVAPRRSSLDARVQRLAVATLRRQLGELTGRNAEDGAVLVLDNASGEVLAWVGSSGALSAAAQVDGVLARRQPGSALKPFVYGLAFERGLLTPASLIDDAPAQLATGGGLYLPQNYDGAHQGWVTARTALGASLNIPAVRVAALVGPDAVHERFNRLGLELAESAWHYGHSLALGGAEVTLLALTNAYRALAQGGVLTPTHDQVANVDKHVDNPMPAAAQVVDNAGGKGVDKRVRGTPDKPGDRLVHSAREGAAARPDTMPAGRVMPSAVAYLIGDILADNNARLRTFGADSALRTRGHAAVKTGTSKDLRDNWCIGWTDRYTVGVWVGNASGAPMHEVSGISGAAPVWAALVAELHRDRPSRAPAMPPGVVRQALRFEPALEPPRDEVFLAGTERAVQRAGTQVTRGEAHGIESPADGSVFALDPDMPAQAQRIRFAGAAGDWWLDGRRVGPGGDSGLGLWWLPVPGRHTLALRGVDGREIHSVRFEVRAPPRPREPAAPRAGR